MTTEEILLELDAAHHRLCEALGKDKSTIHSRAAEEIRILLELVRLVKLLAEEVSAPH